MKKLFVLLAIVVVVASIGVAAAATLPVQQGGELQAGNTVLSNCQTAAVQVVYNPQSNDGAGDAVLQVQGLTVSNLDAACAGKYVLANLLGNETGDPGGPKKFNFANGNWWGSSGMNNCTFASLGGTNGQIPAGGGSVTINFCGSNPFGYAPMQKVIGTWLVISDQDH